MRSNGFALRALPTTHNPGTMNMSANKVKDRNLPFYAAEYVKPQIVYQYRCQYSKLCKMKWAG